MDQQSHKYHAGPMAGFTLIEVVIVILISGILASMGAVFIVQPVTSYFDMSRRADLVDTAEIALRRMQRDVRQALPNSIRIAGGGQYLELLHTVDGGRYRQYLGAPGDDILDFTLADGGFDVLGDLRADPTVGHNLVVYNISPSGPTGNAYAAAPDNMAVVGAGSTVSHINLTPAFDFNNTSPYRRFFILDGPVTYACEGGVLNRYSGYAINAAQQTPPPGAPDLVTRGISGCQFSYDPGVGQRAGLVTLELSLTEEGETISLLHQVHVVNAP